MNQVMQPTVGRKVWVWGHGLALNHDQPMDGTVLSIHRPAQLGAPALVTVHVIDHTGMFSTAHSIELRAPQYAPGASLHDVLDNHHSGVYATWMPFQVKAAQHPALAAAQPMMVGP